MSLLWLSLYGFLCAWALVGVIFYMYGWIILSEKKVSVEGIRACKPEDSVGIEGMKVGVLFPAFLQILVRLSLVLLLLA